jgi:hypothetical protein
MTTATGLLEQEQLPDMPDDGLTPPEFDPDAPYGINPRTGKPYKRSPEHRAKLTVHLTQANERRAREKAGLKPAPAGTSRVRKGETDYRPAIIGLGQLVAAAMFQGSRWVPGLELDGLAVTMHMPAIAEAMQQTAVLDDRMAAILDKITSVGPYGLIIAAVTPLALQIAVNHNIMPPSESAGTYAPADLLAAAGIQLEPEPAQEHE